MIRHAGLANGVGKGKEVAVGWNKVETRLFSESVWE